MMKLTRLEYLLERYVNQTADSEEESEFFQLAEQPENKELLQKLIDKFIIDAEAENMPLPDSEEAILQAIFQARPKVISMRRKRVYGWVAAAVLLLIVGSLWFFAGSERRESRTETAVVPKGHDVKAPNEVNAVLTLSNGQKIVLDSAGNGTLAMQGNVNVVKLADGQISYNQSPAGIPQQVAFNTLTNPRGSKVVTLMLADGTRIWLNAESSLRYPTAFAGDTRVVEITGEAYFEVAHNAEKPFIASVGDMQVEVLGTHFNINAYGDETVIKTTLLEGKVRVTKNSNIGILKPGQQAQINSDNSLKIVNGADVDEVMAWKNGMFIFSSAKINSVMRQLSRWYDVDVSIEDEVANETISGDISRDVNISQVMKMLEYAGVHSKIEGKKIRIMR